SESGYDRVIGEMVKPFGKTYTQDIKIKILGTPEPDTARIAITEMQLPYTVDEFLTIYRAKVKEELQNPTLMPGAEKLVRHLHKHDIPIAVATSSSQDSMELKTKNHQSLFKLFHHIVCGSTDPEVKHGKPAPDIFLVCASRFPDKPSPDQCVVLEDAPNGAKGAIAAGMQAVLVPDPGVPEECRRPATLVLKSLTEFQPELFGLPAFD
ncbi:pseudouridine-5'-monophosphatase, partial [Asbolus verrucosus]